MIRHLILTRSAYGPDYPRDANRRRLQLLRRVTVSSLAAQTEHRWTWLVLLDPRDPLLAQRLDALSLAGVELIPVMSGQLRWAPAPSVPDGRMSGDVSGPWGRAVAGSIEGASRVLMTRIDDDDALATDALARVRQAAERGAPGLQTWILPRGYRFWHGRVQPMDHRSNMFATLESPVRPLRTVMDVKHNDLAELGPVHFVDEAPAWLWVRHGDARSGSRAARIRTPTAVQRLFRVDWSYLGGVL